MPEAVANKSFFSEKQIKKDRKKNMKTENTVLNIFRIAKIF